MGGSRSFGFSSKPGRTACVDVSVDGQSYGVFGPDEHPDGVSIGLEDLLGRVDTDPEALAPYFTDGALEIKFVDERIVVRSAGVEALLEDDRLLDPYGEEVSENDDLTLRIGPVELTFQLAYYASVV